MRRIASLALLCCFSVTAVAQRPVAPKAPSLTRSDKKTMEQLRADISYLASDELEGRRTGSEGERKAGDYLIARYRKLGIPAYQSDYRMPFDFSWGKEVGAGTRIRIGKDPMKVPEEAFPLPFSANGLLRSDVLPDVMEQGNIWMLPLYSSEDEAKDAHFDWEKYAFDKCKEAERSGATGLIFYDNFNSKFRPEFNARSEYETVGIPVVFVTYNPWQLQTSSYKGVIPVDVNVVMKKSERRGTNIAALIDNGAPYTVVIGAHYDHLGHGEDGNSLHAQKDGAIHNGADDNASGTAAVLELAARMKRSKARHYNYLFVHFSGEELGLLGSKAFVKSTGLDSTKVVYMINLDMVGRLNDSTRALTVGGLGTSPAWGPMAATMRSEYKIVVDSSGIGPSDHTSFYNAGIPVLFFFTGTHHDYHKPSDDAPLINYAGEAEIINTLYSVLQSLDKAPRPRFTPTRASTLGKVRFKVTLGIMPDYSYDAGGVRVDGVTEGKPAARAGLKAGDVIIKLGPDDIYGMETYMQALSHRKEGEKTTVVIKRGGQEVTLPVEL